MARRVQHFQFTAETCLEFSPAHFTQMAGLICYYDTRQHFYLRVTHDEKLGKVLGVVLTDDGAYDELAESQIAINDWKQIFLRAAVDGAAAAVQRVAGRQSRGGTSGRCWIFRNCPTTTAARCVSPARWLGLCAQDVGGTHAIADFDYFDYQATKP